MVRAAVDMFYGLGDLFYNLADKKGQKLPGKKG